MIDAVFLAIDLDRLAAKPLFQQLYEALSRAIQQGRLQAESILPASRVFAREIGVSRATVLAAYDQLIAEGYARSRAGSGVYVTDIKVTAQEWLPVGPPVTAVVPPVSRPRPFAHGVPDMRAFPHKLWGQYVGRVARSDAGGLSELPDVFGDWMLRCAIARHLHDWRGVVVAPDQVVVTAGAGDAMELVLLTLADKGAAIGLENPGYPVLARVCEMLGYHPHWLPVDRFGACPAPEGVALSVITPSCQFPLGGTMPVVRRQAHLAAGIWLVEDDFDSEFRYYGAPVPALMALDTRQKVIYLGSFSKVFSGGLRIGYLVFPEPVIDRARQVMRMRGARASAMPQRVLARFMQDGAFHRHVRKMRRLYRGRREIFLQGVQDRFAGLLSYQDHGAGMSVALEFSREVDSAQLKTNLSKVGLDCALLSSFYGAGPAKSGLLCGFCAFDSAEMDRGFDQLQLALANSLKPDN